MTSAPRPLLDALVEVFGEDRVVSRPEQLLTYEADGHTLTRSAPGAVVYPDSTREVQAAVRLCNEHDVPFLARGAGTGLSGGAVARGAGLIIETSRMNRILSIDYDSRLAVVQPGVVNLALSRETRPRGLQFAPDPSSQGACTIGGNVAENSGGPHTLRHGVTTNHVLALEIVLPDGEILEAGGEGLPCPGYDLRGVFVGSEGTFGIATAITVRLTPVPLAHRTFLAVFDDIDDASATVSAIIAGGIVPDALELIDRLTIEAVERHLKVGFPRDAAALLLIELEGLDAELGPAADAVVERCRAHGCREVRRATDEKTRQQFWRGRKLALGALGKIARAYYTHDGVVPRSRLPEAVRGAIEIGRRHGLRVANVCHAGDGNLHPMLLYDPDDADQVRRVHEAGAEVLRLCVDLGGALTGEHGIGQEKQECMPWMFDANDLDQMQRVRAVFDPAGRCNPEKVFPLGGGCGELRPARAERIGGWL